MSSNNSENSEPPLSNAESDILSHLLRLIESEVSVPADFMTVLLKEDDWSFIIKLHSLFEASISHLLVHTLGRNELADVISQMEMSNIRTGKLAFVKSLELLDGDSRRFIQKLSEVRNKFVHDVENVTTTLSDFFASLEEGDRKGFVKAFKWGYANADDVDIQTEDGLYDIHKTLKMLAVTTWNIHHKISIWAGSLVVLRQVHQKITDSKIDSLRRQYNDEVGLILKEVIDAKKRIDNDDTVPELKVAEPSTS